VVVASVWTPYVTAAINGVPITGVRRARVISTFTDPVTKIYVNTYPQVSWAEEDVITVTMGGGLHNVVCGTGTIFTSRASNDGSYELSARGPLFKAQRYTNNRANGITLADLTGGPATDQAIAAAVLTIAGVTFNPLDIGGTGIIRGSLAPDAYTWRQGETALAYLVRLSKASLGYRMIENVFTGSPMRVQVYGRPQATAQFTLREGVDIFPGANTDRDTLGKYTAITVTGFDYGAGDGPVSFSIPDPIPDGVEPYVYPSEMIERALEADAGDGISAENVATNFVEPEVNRVSVKVSGVKTPRDDLFAPGQTVMIDSPLLDLAEEKVWLYSTTREADRRWFTQTLDFVGGSSATGGYTGP